MYTFVTTLILTFVCFNAYVYGESHFVCKKMEEVFSSHKGDSGAIPSSQMRIGKQGIKGEKGEKPVLDYSTINATVESYIRKERSSVAANNVRMIEKMFENMTAKIDALILNNTEQAEKMAEQAEKIAEQARKIINLEDYDRMIRLVDGNSIKNGRIEVFHNGIWGTVCDDGWNNDRNGKRNADVACRQLGFSRSTWFELGIIIGHNRERYGAGTGQIWLDGVICTGSENTLSDCPHNEWGVHNCGHGEDVGVECE